MGGTYRHAAHTEALAALCVERGALGISSEGIGKLANPAGPNVRAGRLRSCSGGRSSHRGFSEDPGARLNLPGLRQGAERTK